MKQKVQKLVRSSLSITHDTNYSEWQPLISKKKKLNNAEVCSDEDLQAVLAGEKLSDQHIHIAQCLIKEQFPHVKGLQSTLLQLKHGLTYEAGTDHLQVIHSRGDHWVLASTVGCEGGTVNLYDSVYHSLDEVTLQVVHNLFQHFSINMISSQKQEGGTDCGLFVIASATAIAFGVNPTTVTFKQTSMRGHLVKCFKERKMSVFPIV